MYWNPKKWIPMLFATKLSIKFPRLGHAQWSWPRNDRLVTNDVTSGISQSFMLLFCLLDDRIALPTSICFFLVEENSSLLLKQQLSKLEGFRDSWLDVTTHSETQTLFCTDSRSTSLGVAEVGTLRPDFRALKSQNPFFFFLEYLFTQYRGTITIKTLLAV